MAPFSIASRVTPAAKEGQASSTYSTVADDDWTVVAVPNGGYVLTLVLEASIKHQSGTDQPDPLHISAHFLQPTKIKTPTEIQVRVLKAGRNYVNILADLVQAGRACVTTHIIFGKVPIRSHPIIAPSTGYARRLPLLLDHPSLLKPTHMPSAYIFSKHLQWSEDSVLKKQNEANHARTPGGGVALWGAWIELKGESERVTPSSLAFFADCIHNMATLYPSHVTGIDLSKGLWSPTLTMSLEYKTPIPSPSDGYASRTVGVYVKSGYLADPQNRHNSIVEIWSAPSNIGEGNVDEDWQGAQVCLATGSQMQLMVDGAVNKKAGRANL
ncbi:unnamed protein product [Mycena citricolor]|uniref:Acyl-CoA thioesterase-like N-terminal HotDog domain-containing protein n=1 Tax=Mycena citricolor TaxID=2018698 RepID=A0AAD2HNB9_9AGAR|nr:unnamed protein product [Mycena citricolor]